MTINGTDPAGNSNEPATNNIFTIDNTKPTVALTYDLNRAVSSADTLAITATFTQGMRASPQVSIQNATGDTIQAATNMTGATGDTVWTFSFTVPDGNSGDATVIIDGLDIAGNGNETASNNTFTIDNSGPAVALTYNPDRAVSSADTVTITATFNENIVSSTPQITIVNGTGDTIQAATNMTGSSGDVAWTFDFTVPDGNSGDATVTISGGKDQAGNTNQTASNNTFTIDNTGPSVALTYSPDRAVSSADTLAITATFSQGVSASPQISIVNGTGDEIQAATNMTGSAGDTVWTFDFTVPDGNSGDAIVTIVGTDPAGNTNQTATNNTFTIDNTPPQVALTYNPDRAVSSADTLVVTATFAQGMSASPQISIVNGTADSIQAATNMTGSAGDTVWTFNFTVPAGNSGDATVTITGTDIAGNSNEAATNNTFTIDNTPPQVALTYNPDRAVSSGDTLVVTATFTQGMSASPQISILNGTGDSIQAATNMTGSAGDTVWTFNFTVPAGNSGDATVTITGTDIAGNTNETATNTSFTIDNTSPTVAVTYNPDRILSSADTVTITATFSQGMMGAPQISIVDGSGTIQTATSMTGTTGDTVWTFSFSVPDTADGTTTVTIAGKDIAGNANESASNNTFIIDTTPPVLLSAEVIGTTLVLTYTEVNGLNTGSVPAAQDFLVSSDQRSYNISNVAIGTNTVTLTVAPGVQAAHTGVIVSYTLGAGNPRLLDGTGNQAADLVNQAVTNNT